jgi:hypothetical protein
MSVILPSLIEAVARALAEENGFRAGELVTIGGQTQFAWRFFEAPAKAALAAVAKGALDAPRLRSAAGDLDDKAARGVIGLAHTRATAAELLRALAEAADA